MTNDIRMILTERGDRYGKFTGHAALTQHLKGVIRQALLHEGRCWQTTRWRPWR